MTVEQKVLETGDPVEPGDVTDTLELYTEEGMPLTIGLLGAKGNKGERGPRGFNGPRGLTGRPGPKGDPGTGASGTISEQIQQTLIDPNGSDDSTAVSAALAALNHHGRLFLGEGTWRAKLGTIGSSVAGQGVNFSLKGAGPTKTILAPVDNTAGILRLIGPGDASSDFFEIDDIGISLPFDMDYAKALIQVVIQKGMLRIGENVRWYCGNPNNPNSLADYMGTFLLLDGAYEGEIGGEFRCRKNAVPIEFVNITNASSLGIPPNLDTIRWSPVFDGVHGAIFRDAYSQIHGMIFDGLKATNTVSYPEPPYGEMSIAAGGASSGSANFDVDTVPEMGSLPEVGDAVGIGVGDTYEVGKVTDVTDNGDGTTAVGLAKVLRFDHDAGMPLIIGGKVLSFGDGYTAIDLRGFHFEGHQIGISAGNVRALLLNSGMNNTGELVRLEGETRRVYLGPGIESQGTAHRHVIVNKAPYSDAPAGTYGDHFGWEPMPPSDPADWYIDNPVVFNNVGNGWHLIKRDHTAGSGTSCYVVNGNSGANEQLSDAYRSQVGGVRKYGVTHSGKGSFPGGVVLCQINTTGLTDAQIDTQVDLAVTGSSSPSNHGYEDGIIIEDPDNGLLLMRMAGVYLRYGIEDGGRLLIGEATLRRNDVSASNSAMTSGLMRVGCFTARKTESITTLRIPCGAVAAAATPTLIRLGVFEIDRSSGDATLIKSTANDTSLLATPSTPYTKSLSSTWNKIAGKRYGIGLLVVTGATVPQVYAGGTALLASEGAQLPKLAFTLSGQSDLPSSVAVGSQGASSTAPYIVAVP